MALVEVSTEALPGSLALLIALGQGENGFGGTPVGDDPGKLDEWLEYCVHLSNAPPLSDDFLPQTNYWITNGSGHAVGLVRMNPRLNPQLFKCGGHVGYYIAPAFRRQGYGKAGLRLALGILQGIGVEYALITVESDNIPSLGLVESLGGILEDERIAEETGRAYRRFWVATANAKP